MGRRRSVIQKWRVAAVVSCAALVIGSVAPWASTFLGDVLGIEGDGKYCLALGLTAGLLAFASPPGSNAIMLAAILAAASAFVAGIDIAHIYRHQPVILGHEIDLVNIGWGLWLTALGSVALAVAAAVLWTRAEVPEKGETL